MQKENDNVQQQLDEVERRLAEHPFVIEQKVLQDWRKTWEFYYFLIFGTLLVIPLAAVVVGHFYEQRSYRKLLKKRDDLIGLLKKNERRRETVHFLREE